MRSGEGRKVERDGKGDLRDRTKAFALRIIRMYAILPKKVEAQVLGKQRLRSGTSVGAHYREACRARSRAEFVSKVEGGLQELAETVYWLELLSEGGLLPDGQFAELRAEADQLTAILVASAKTAKRPQ
jgi:four helix bundle protein